MRLIVSYDVSTLTPEGRSRLRRVAKACKSFGVRVQYSVFECSVNETQLIALRARTLSIVNADEDSLRIYFLSGEDSRKTEHYGVRPALDPDGPIVV